MKTLTTKHLVFAVIALLVFIIFARFMTLAPPPQASTHEVSIGAQHIEDKAVGDQTAETVRVLTQQVNQVLRQNEQLVEQQQVLEAQLARQHTVQSFKDKDREDNPLHQMVTDLRQQVDSLTNSRTSTYPVHDDQPQESYGYVWVEEQNGHVNPQHRVMPELLNQLPSTIGIQPPVAPLPTPFYTLPIGATLTDAVLMSALIGRIPIRGTVTSPYPFKALVGHENLAANGIVIPHLEGVVVTGRATGDMNLHCTQAHIDALTFVFQDGRISTTVSQGNEPLGHLSTLNGNPCIPGTLFTNAPKHLATLAGLGAIEGAANAYAEAQVKETTSPNDVSRRQVVGSHAKYVLGLSGKQAAGDVRAWYNDRIENSFDAIYTRAGMPVVINIEQQIEIDDDSEGRKTSYESDMQSSATRHLP